MRTKLIHLSEVVSIQFNRYSGVNHQRERKTEQPLGETTAWVISVLLQFEPTAQWQRNSVSKPAQLIEIDPD